MKLRKILQNGLFTTQKALKHGITKKDLTALLEQGVIERLARGIYQDASLDRSGETEYRLATLIVGRPSAVCLLSALSHHHLTDIIPKKNWMLVPVQKKPKHSLLRLLRAKNPNWQIGILKEEGYWVTNLERTIVDCLVYKKLLGTQVAVEALRKVLEEKETTLAKILDMAVCLKVEHRIIATIEALA